MSTIKKISYNSPDFVIQSIGKLSRSGNQFYLPMDVLLDRENNLIVSELGNNRIHKTTTNGTTISSNFIGSGLPGKSFGHLSLPRGITLSSEGKLFVCDSKNQRILKFNISDGKFEGVFSTNILGEPHIIQITPNEDRVLLSNYKYRIAEYTATGELIGFINPENEDFDPSGIAFNSRGDLLIGECSQSKIELFDMREREFITSFKISAINGFRYYKKIYLTTDSFDNIIVSNTDTRKIEIFDTGFEPISIFNSDNIDMDHPFGICVDENHGRIIFCDNFNDRLQIIQYLNFQ